MVGAGRAIDGAGPRIQLQPQVMAGKVVEVVEGVLRQAQQVLGFLFLELVRLDGDAQRKDWPAGLHTEKVGKSVHG